MSPLTPHRPSTQAQEAFAPYVVCEGSLGIEGILDWCHMVGRANQDQGITNPFDLYERLLDVLGEQRFDTVPLSGLMAPFDPSRVRVSLRHDLDANLVPALQCAEALEKRGLVGSFYPLHTSYYYAELTDGVAARQPGVQDLVQRLAASRQEIGLHIDPLHLYFAHGIDGTAAVLVELEWLRSVVGPVTGVVAHNSAPVYGAENFEVLRGLALAGRTSVTWRGRTAPLQTIDWASSGLAYEGNHPLQPGQDDAAGLPGYLANVPPDALRRADWQAIYLLHNPVFDRSYDASLWLIGRNCWSAAEHRPTRRLFANIDTDTAFDWLQRVPAGRRVVIVMHPEYLSAS